ncbi:O-fucosyltransferase family protein [Striga hermonthica]|uniref:GDP-fucose protein O-fucosyltransferase 2 n=1 Tax=Striga hermonthica TaxID=68872 RepID=A0A9N7MFF9_STRHE|nr:O-fucosyltransferase family protein [Striga hermonthica]
MMQPQPTNEDDDCENLITNGEGRSNGRKSPDHLARSTFRIGGVPGSASSGASNRFGKWCIFAIILLFSIFVLFLATDVKDFFRARTSWSEDLVNSNASVSRMRESELQALHLLKQQEVELLKMVNRSEISFLNGNSSVDGAFLLSSSVLEDLKSRVFSQISLNKQIQGVLLSSHGNGSLDSDENYTNTSALGWDRCCKVDQRLSERRTKEWNPRPDKYLLAVCVSGQMSNHLICLEKHMFFAAMLDRVLVIPSAKVDYEFSRVIDIDHINSCSGKKVVTTFEEFAEIKKNHMQVDKFLCYFSLPQPCFLDDDHVKKLKDLGLLLSKIETVWEEDVKEPKNRTVQDVLDRFSSDDDVIAIGDVFFANIETEWVMQPGGPIAHKCKTLIEPSRFILLTAQRFVQTFLGKDFIALHFRRHGFLKFCNAKKPSCFYPVPQAAECINRVVERANSPVIYLSTDAAESETGLLQSLVVWNGKTVPLVQRPASNVAEKWDALLYRHGLTGDSQVEAMLDKAICALSKVFIGSPGSTFTEDILRLRKDWGSASLCDEYLCQGELPNFIAEDE